MWPWLANPNPNPNPTPTPDPNPNHELDPSPNPKQVRPVWSPCTLHQVVPHLLRQLTVYDVPGLTLLRVGATPGAPGFV